MAAMNPILTEIQGLSPEAKGALGMAGHTLPTPAATASATAPASISPGMLLPRPAARPEPGPISMGGSPPPLAMPSTSPDLVTGPNRGQAMMTNGESTPMGTMAGDSAERSRLLSTGSGISQIGNRIENSRLGEAHPFLGKLLGGLAQGAATVGDIGLSAVAPEIAVNTPGTEYHHQALLNHASGALNQDVGNAQKEAQTASENATAGHLNAETPEIAPNAESTRALQGSEVTEHNAQAAALLHPQAKTDFEAWQQQNPGKPIEDWLKDLAANKPEKPDPARQQLVDEYQRTHPGATLAKANEYASSALQAPQRAPIVNMFVPGANGSETLQTVRPGQTIAPGAQTASGVNSMNTPTTTQRTAAGRADTVIQMAPEVLARIDATASQMGPVAGRWDQFMQGKVGAPNVAMADLRSDLLMMSSAVALAHAQGRLPENLREEFDAAINAPHQSPENLKGTIQTMIPWLVKVRDQGDRPNGATAPAPQPNAAGVENWVRGPDGKLVKQ